MSESVTQPRDPSLDIANISAGDFPWQKIERLTGTREARFQSIIKQCVLDDIHAHGKSSPEAEICGVLVGNVFRDESGAYLLVHASIRGDAAEGRAAQVTFKAETWTHIQDIMEREHADARIVGWYHTHPGFGIFLSGMDLFIQDHFFNLPWQVAFVYDPTSGEEGLFVWREGKSEREPFLIQEDTPDEIRARPGYEWQPPNQVVVPPPPKDPYSSGTVMLLAMIAFIVSFSVAMVMMYKPWEPKQSPATAPATGPATMSVRK